MRIADFLGAGSGRDDEAVTDEVLTLTRGELFERAKAISTNIAAVTPADARIAVTSQRTAASVVDIVGGLLSGRCVVLVPADVPNGADLIAATQCAATLADWHLYPPHNAPGQRGVHWHLDVGGPLARSTHLVHVGVHEPAARCPTV